jgi:hypothetical protein
MHEFDAGNNSIGAFHNWENLKSGNSWLAISTSVLQQLAGLTIKTKSKIG